MDKGWKSKKFRGIMSKMKLTDMFMMTVRFHTTNRFHNSWAIKPALQVHFNKITQQYII